MITIYDENTTDFNNNGLTVLNEVISAVVEEELNGIYKLELEYPITNSNKWRYIKEGNVIKCPTPNGLQLFRIYKPLKTLNSMKCVAFHVFYDLLDNFIEDRRPTNLTGASAIVDLFKGTQFPSGFTVSSNIDRVNTAYYIRKNPIEALLSDDQNSFLNRWGGEVLRNNFNIQMNVRIGHDTGYKIQYGKNLTGFEEDKDMSNVVTKIMPTGLYENDSVLMLPEKYIESVNIGKYRTPKIKHIHFSDFKVNKEEGITESDVQNMLRKAVKKMYEIDKVDLPRINFKVDFIELSKTKEYEQFQVIERVMLGDTLQVYYPELDINLISRVIAYKYNSITEMYDSLELGHFKGNLIDNITSQNKRISDMQKTLIEVSQVVQENKDSMDNTIKEITKTITSALGGHVLKRNGELLIMDTEDVQTAKNVWRFNLNGLGYSSTGYNGNFETAITMDGKIVGKFLKGEVIQGVSLQGVEVLSVDNPHWTGYDITGESRNIARLTKGGLEFRSRNNFETVWNKDFAVDIDGFGIRTSRAQPEWDAPTKDYGRGTLRIAGPYINAETLPDGSGGSLSIRGKGIEFGASEFLLPSEASIKHTSFGSDGELGKICKPKGSMDYIVSLKPTEWESLDYLNGWVPVNYNELIGWSIDPSGVIRLRGRVKGGKPGTVIAQVPIQGGLGKSATMGSQTYVVIFPAISEKGLGRIEIDRGGKIICRLNPGGWISLDSVVAQIVI